LKAIFKVPQRSLERGREGIMRSRISHPKGLEEEFRSDKSVMEGKCAVQAWRARVMKRIRRIGQVNPVAGFWSVVENLVWGLSPGSTLLLLLLTILCLRMYLNLGQDYLSTAAAYLES
jgi:hypothetical protein